MGKNVQNIPRKNCLLLNIVRKVPVVYMCIYRKTLLISHLITVRFSWLDKIESSSEGVKYAFSDDDDHRGWAPKCMMLHEFLSVQS